MLTFLFLKHQHKAIFTNGISTFSDNALSDFEAAVKCDSNHLDAHLHIAALHHEAERFEEAGTGWRSVLAIDEDHVVARTRLDECEIKLMS